MKRLVALILLASFAVSEARAGETIGGSCSPNGAEAVSGGVLLKCVSSVWAANSVQVGDDSATCDSAKAGAIRWSSSALQYCNGSSWAAMGSGGGVSADSLDFTEFMDSLTLDASTAIVATGTNVLSIVNTGSGITFLVNDEASDASPFVIAADGKVGIGTAVASYKLDVVSTSSQARFRHNTSGEGFLISQNSSGGPVELNNQANEDLLLSTNNAEKMRVTADGKVGIGTTDPSQKLTVQTAAGAFGFAHTDGTRTLSSYVDDSGGWIGTLSNHPLHLYTNDSGALLTVATNGNVGIGTTVPSVLMELHADNPALELQDSGAGGTIWRIKNGVSGNGILTFTDNDDARMAITNTGNVGIGTSSPAAKLDVSGAIKAATKTDSSSTADALPNPDNVAYGVNATYSSDGGGMFAWYQGTADHTDLAIWYGDDSNADLHFLRGSWDGAYQDLTDVMILTAAGNVGIGTTSPGSTLDVKGTLRLSGSTSGYVGLAPAAAAGSTTYTLPSADGSSGQQLTTNGGGTLSWAAAGSGGGADIQTFTASGTWTKPSSGTIAMVECWGGGGGGGRSSQAGGGGGGGYNTKWIPLASLGATETVTVGAGGAGKSGSDGVGTVGGNSTFGAHLSAYGGGGGTTVTGGGGGGPSGAGSGSTPGLPLMPTGTGGTGTFYAGQGTLDGGYGTCSGIVPGGGTWHGGGGACGSIAGAASIYGGGGGGGYQSGVAGKSVYGGNGGAAGTGNGVAGSSGTQPGGGGGGCRGATCGSGAAGQCKATVF